jgi:hypothetical protein
LLRPRVPGDGGPLPDLLVGRRLGDCLRWSVDGEAGEGLNWRRAA